MPMTLGSMMDPQAMQGAMMPPPGPPPGMPPGGMGMAPPQAPPMPAQPQRSPQQFALDLRSAMRSPNVLAAISQLVEDYGMPPSMVSLLLQGEADNEPIDELAPLDRPYRRAAPQRREGSEGALPNGGNVGPATSKSYGSGEPNLGMRNGSWGYSGGGNAKHSYSGGSKATDGSGGAPIKTNMGSPDPGAVRNNEYGYPTSKKKRRY